MREGWGQDPWLPVGNVRDTILSFFDTWYSDSWLQRPLPEQDPDQPVISDVSTYAVVVGETIEFYGANLRTAKKSKSSYGSKVLLEHSTARNNLLTYG